jgi:cell pole-organizing protein PopZ
MANPSTAHEPSMEEILASIRQIISEEGDSVGSREAAHRGGEWDAAPDPDGRSADAEADDGDAAPAASAFRAAMKPPPDEYAAGEPLGSAAEARTRQPLDSGSVAAGAAAGAPGDRLLSPSSDVAVSGAFSALAHTILAQNARTLEDLVTEMLKPMLKEWLDDNLPTLVERLVQEEIQRVSRGRR